MSLKTISKVFVLYLHSYQLEMFGGAQGLSNEGLLDSAITQPFASFDGNDLYLTIEEKAARYAFSIVKNHPFVDGNKRTGAAAMVAFLKVNGYEFLPDHKEFETIILGVAGGEISYETLVEFVRREAKEQQ